MIAAKAIRIDSFPVKSRLADHLSSAVWGIQAIMWPLLHNLLSFRAEIIQKECSRDVNKQKRPCLKVVISFCLVSIKSILSILGFFFLNLNVFSSSLVAQIGSLSPLIAGGQRGALKLINKAPRLRTMQSLNEKAWMPQG